jgi:micrococcal nuclease
MSRPRRWSRRSRLQVGAIILLVILVVIAVAVRTCDGTGAPAGGTVTTAPAGATETSLPTPDTTTVPVATATTAGASATDDSGGRRIDDLTLLEVVDGDTIWIRMPDGSHEKVRYIGIDAPEIAHEDSPGEYLGEEASTHNAELLASGPLSLETDIEERDEYGRLLAYVYAGDVFVNERMVLDGYAWAHDYPPNLSLQEQLWAAHDEARAAGRGVWAEESD